MSADPWLAAGAVPASNGQAPSQAASQAPANDPWAAAGAIPAAAGHMPAQAQNNDAPAPPIPEDGSAPAALPHTGFVGELLDPARQAWSALKTDADRAYDATVNRKPGQLPDDRALGSVVGDIGKLIVSPVTGITNAAVVQPGAKVLDNLPAPIDPKTGARMTPEQQHAANANIISTALMGLGPKGLKGGAVAESALSHYAGKVAGVVSKVPPEVALDEKGALSPEGVEAAAQAGVHPEDLEAGYKAVQDAKEAPEAAPQAAPAPEAAPAPPVEAAAPVEPTGPIETPPSEAPAAPPEAPQPEPLPQSAQDRVAQAQSEGVDLTKGQALQDFGTQEKEQGLLAAATPDGSAARQFFGRQQQQIADAIDRFKAAIGAQDLSPVERGQLLQDSMRDLRDSGKAGVTALYKQAQQLVEGLGDQNSNLGRLNTLPLIDAMRGIMIDEAVPAGVRNAIRQQAAQYGLIGGAPRIFEDGTATVKVRDAGGEEGPSITLPRPPQPLTVANAEDLRQAFNRIYQENRSASVLGLKPVLDQVVQDAVEEAVANGGGEIGNAFKAARAAHQAQQQTFAAKDVVQKLIDWKVRGVTPQVLPENAVKTVLAGGKDAVTDLKKVKAVLLSKPTAESKAAWQAIQAHAVAEIFDKALVLNARMDGGELGTISGAKLNTAIAKFGVDKLKVLLPEAEFNQLMKLKRVIGDATIPIEKTTNPSGSGWAVIRFLAGQGMKLGSMAGHFIPGAHALGDVARGFYTIGKQSAEAKATLKGIESFTPEAAAKVDAKAEAPKSSPTEFARDFIKVAGSDRTLAAIMASAANDQQDRQASR